MALLQTLQGEGFLTIIPSHSRIKKADSPSWLSVAYDASEWYNCFVIYGQNVVIIKCENFY